MGNHVGVVYIYGHSDVEQEAMLSEKHRYLLKQFGFTETSPNNLDYDKMKKGARVYSFECGGFQLLYKDKDAVIRSIRLCMNTMAKLSENIGLGNFEIKYEFLHL